MPATGIAALSKEWHEVRQHRITATDVPVILGIGGYKNKGSILDVWGRLTGKVTPEKVEVTPEMEWGNDSEELNAKLFARETARQVKPCGELWQHPTLPFLYCTPDYWQAGEDGEGVLELKAPSIYTRENWLERVPIAFQVQALVQMMCTETGFGSCSALIPPGVVWDDVKRNGRLETQIAETLTKFWEHNVEGLVEPDVQLYKAEYDLAALRRLHPNDNGELVELDAEALDAAEKLELVSVERKALESEEKVLKAKIQQCMGDNTYAVGGAQCFSWKTQTTHYKPRDEFTRTSRVFRRVKSVPGGSL
jgi:putative phage-type endonuclease